MLREKLRRCSPSSVKLHVCIKQGNDGRRSSPPAADSGPDQSFLLVVADHLDEPWTVLSIGLLHKALQVVFELPCEQKNDKHTHTLSESRLGTRSSTIEWNETALFTAQKVDRDRQSPARRRKQVSLPGDDLR